MVEDGSYEPVLPQASHDCDGGGFLNFVVVLIAVGGQISQNPMRPNGDRVKSHDLAFSLLPINMNSVDKCAAMGKTISIEYVTSLVPLLNPS